MDYERLKRARGLVMTIRRKRSEQASLLWQGRKLKIPADVMRFTRDELRKQRYVSPLYVRPKMSQLLKAAEAMGRTIELLEANPDQPIEKVGLDRIVEAYGEVGCQAMAAVASAQQHGKCAHMYRQLFVDAARVVSKPLSLVGEDV